MNTLDCGDCLDVLRKQVKDESVDLIYIDPPFNTSARSSARSGSDSELSSSF
jgi:16S rRNA G966 N2-methylase RsmD